MSEPLNAVDLSSFEQVARATTLDMGRRARWTVLTIWHRPDKRRPFVAEVFGGTSIVGERERRRRAVAATLEGCFDLFDDGGLTEEMRRQCREWLACNGHKVREHQRETTAAALCITLGYLGDASRPLGGALAWLYPDGVGQLTWTDAERFLRFERDFGVPAPAVARACVVEARQGMASTPWVRALIGSLMFFDRTAFHKAGGFRNA